MDCCSTWKFRSILEPSIDVKKLRAILEPSIDVKKIRPILEPTTKLDKHNRNQKKVQESPRTPLLSPQDIETEAGHVTSSPAISAERIVRLSVLGHGLGVLKRSQWCTWLGLRVLERSRPSKHPQP